jgi:hypothetical protein
MALQNQSAVQSLSPPTGPGLDYSFIARSGRSFSCLSAINLDRAARKVYIMTRMVESMHHELCTASGGNYMCRFAVNQFDFRHFPTSSHLECTRYLRMHFLSHKLSKDGENIETAIMDHIRAGVEYESSSSLQKLHANLPLELRDIVYGFILGEQLVGVAKKAHHTQEPGKLARPPSIAELRAGALLASQLTSNGYADLLARDAMPNCMMYELAEVWLHSSIFRSATSNELRYFLDNPGTFYVLSPRAHISKIEFYSYIGPQTSVDDWGLLVELRQIVRYLGGFKPRTEITLSLHLEQTYCGVEGDRSAAVLVNRLVTPLSPVIKQLLEHDYQVFLKFGHSLKFEAKPGEITEERWNEEIRVHREVWTV